MLEVTIDYFIIKQLLWMTLMRTILTILVSILLAVQIFGAEKQRTNTVQQGTVPATPNGGRGHSNVQKPVQKNNQNVQKPVRKQGLRSYSDDPDDGGSAGGEDWIPWNPEKDGSPYDEDGNGTGDGLKGGNPPTNPNMEGDLGGTHYNPLHANGLGIHGTMTDAKKRRNAYNAAIQKKKIRDAKKKRDEEKIRDEKKKEVSNQ
ncbi:hypothetical protein FACS189419_08330 [Planctomycetales bacterium]|nr:hypothetical protein FACS189419_08330 [Planctomycetales bacterium]